MYVNTNQSSLQQSKEHQKHGVRESGADRRGVEEEISQRETEGRWYERAQQETTGGAQSVEGRWEKEMDTIDILEGKILYILH